MGWSQRDEPGRGFRLALGSFVEEYANRVSIIQRRDAYEQAVGTGVGRDRTAQALAARRGRGGDDAAFVTVGEFEHPRAAAREASYESSARAGESALPRRASGGARFLGARRGEHGSSARAEESAPRSAPRRSSPVHREAVHDL